LCNSTYRSTTMFSCFAHWEEEFFRRMALDLQKSSDLPKLQPVANHQGAR
jgi:hypothetical protein